MLELPEALTIARQLNSTVNGKKIVNVVTLHSPHKFAFFNGDPAEYAGMLVGKTVGKSAAYGGMVEITVEDMVILLGDGVNLRYHPVNEDRPIKHQLLIEFEDLSAISGSVQMYGGINCFKKGEFDNKYYIIAKNSISPLSEGFNDRYFGKLIDEPSVQKLSAKAFLATEQRIPGLGNGVLQDILYISGIHPKRKVNTLDDEEKQSMFNSIKSTLEEMASRGGRDTETDLFGCPGGYISKLSKNTAGKECKVCGSIIKKEAYLGGSIYFCSGCQKV